MSSLLDIKIPDLGEYDDVDVIEVLVKKGDIVKCEDSLITLETDKASMDVPSPVDGKIEKMNVKVGDKVSSNIVIGKIRSDKKESISESEEENLKKPKSVEKPANKKTEEISPIPSYKTTSRNLPSIDEKNFSGAHASPSVRKLARELGVNLIQVVGTGVKNRILHDDIKNFVKAIMFGSTTISNPLLPKIPIIDFTKYGETEIQKLTKIQKISGKRLHASWINLPHVTQYDLADITGLEKERQRLKKLNKTKDINLTPLAFIIKACVNSLKEFPKVNSSLSEDETSIILKNYWNIAFATDTENGLMVPVMFDADKKDIFEIAKELGTLSKIARENKLDAKQLQGGTFTISSLGSIGGTVFSPIINAPEVAILGISKSSVQPIWNGKKFEPRLMLPLSLSYDHRVIDGAYAVRFTTFLSQQLSNVKQLLETKS